MLTLAQAHDKVADLCEPDADPILAPDELDAALIRTALASIWLPSTAYAVGQRVVPPVPLGRVFVCVLAGVSDTTEPQWLIAPSYTGPVNPLAGSWWGLGIIPLISNVTATPWYWGLGDGTAAWRAAENFAGEIYDVYGAAASLWRAKARKAANRVDSTIAGAGSIRDSQTYDRCMHMAAIMQPVRFV